MHPFLPVGSSQGISVEEGTTQQQAISGTENRPTAFIGAALRGPIDQPVLLSGTQDYEKSFGPLSQQSPMSYAVRMFFLNGGRQAWVVRIAHQARSANIELTTDEGSLFLHSLCAGTHDYLRAAVDYDGINITDSDCFNLTVQRLGAPTTENVLDQEIYRYVSIAEDHPNFVSRSLAASQLVRAEADGITSRPHATLNYASGQPEYFRSISTPGSNGGRVTMADVLGCSSERTGLFALTKQHDFSQLYIPPLTFDMDLGVPVLRAAARICERRYAMLIVDTPKIWTDQNMVLNMIDRFSLRGGNVAMYYPWVLVKDPVSNKVLKIPPGGAVAGVLDRCMGNSGPSGTPAGQNIMLRGIQQFAEEINETEGYRLARKGINSLRRSKGGRKVVWDAVLLGSNDGKGEQIGSLRIRRLMHYVAKSIEHGLQWTIFEQNNERLWKKVHDQVYSFLLHCMNHGLLQGAVPDNSFTVHCDQGTNPGILRAQNKVGLEIQLAPIQPSRFVKLRFELPTAGNQENG